MTPCVLMNSVWLSYTHRAYFRAGSFGGRLDSVVGRETPIKLASDRTLKAWDAASTKAFDLIR